jgi:hypothetical protein
VHKIAQDDLGKIYLFMRGYSKKAQNGVAALLLMTAYQTLVLILALLDGLFHHPADIRQASAALGIQVLAMTTPLLLLYHDLLRNQGASIFRKVLFNVLSCEPKTITYKILYLMLLYQS